MSYEAYSWVLDRREWWWSRASLAKRVAKLKRALTLCGLDSRRLMAYDIPSEAYSWVDKRREWWSR